VKKSYFNIKFYIHIACIDKIFSSFNKCIVLTITLRIARKIEGKIGYSGAAPILKNNPSNERARQADYKNINKLFTNI